MLTTHLHLTDDELLSLTHLRRPSAQARALQVMGVPYRTRPRDRQSATGLLPRNEDLREFVQELKDALAAQQLATDWHDVPEREAFEAWVGKGMHLEQIPTGAPFAGDYRSIVMQTRWDAWQAACAWQREKDAKLCEAYAIDRHALYKGRHPYTGKEPQRYDPYTEGASDAADLCAEKIRSAG